MSNTNPDESQQGTERSQDTHHMRAKRKATPPKLYISFMPDGRGGAREDKGSVPLDIDVEAHIEERTDCETGLYRIDKKRSGEFSGEVLWYTKEDYSVAPSFSTHEDEEDLDPPFQSSAPQSANTLDAASIAKLVAETVNATLEARDKRERIASGQPTALDQAERMYELAERSRREAREELRDMLSQQNPQPATQQLDEETVLTKAVLSKGLLKKVVENAVDAIGSADSVGEPLTWADRLMDLARGFIPYVAPSVGPVVGHRLVGLINQVDDGTLMQAVGIQGQLQPQPAHRPAVPVPPVPVRNEVQQAADVQASTQGDADDDAPITFDTVLGSIVTDLQDGNDPDDAINDIVRLTTSQTGFAPVIAGMMSEKNARLVQMLSEAKGVDLTQLVNADEYINALRDGLKKRIRLPEPLPTAASANNGHNGAVVAKTA